MVGRARGWNGRSWTSSQGVDEGMGVFREDLGLGRVRGQDCEAVGEGVEEGQMQV